MPQEPLRGVKFLDTPPSADTLIAAVAGRQHGLITTAQLAARGLGYAAVSRRVAAGRLHRRHRGVYSVGHARLSQEGQWLAAVLAAGEGAALSHLAAARLWNVWRRAVRGIDVLAPRRRQVKGVRVHTARRLDAARRDRSPRHTGHHGAAHARGSGRGPDRPPARERHPRGGVPQPLLTARHPGGDGARERPRPARLSNRPSGSTPRAARAPRATWRTGSSAELRPPMCPSPSSMPPFRRPSAATRWTSAGATSAWRSTGPVTGRARTQAEDDARDRALIAAGYRVIRVTPRPPLHPAAGPRPP